jgi:hypothetical protein
MTNKRSLQLLTLMAAVLASRLAAAWNNTPSTPSGSYSGSPVVIDEATDQVDTRQLPCLSLALPNHAADNVCPGATLSTTGTDYCTNTANGLVCAGSNGLIPPPMLGTGKDHYFVMWENSYLTYGTLWQDPAQGILELELPTQGGGNAIWYFHGRQPGAGLVTYTINEASESGSDMAHLVFAGSFDNALYTIKRSSLDRAEGRLLNFGGPLSLQYAPIGGGTVTSWLKMVANAGATAAAGVGILNDEPRVALDVNGRIAGANKLVAGANVKLTGVTATSAATATDTYTATLTTSTTGTATGTSTSTATGTWIGTWTAPGTWTGTRSGTVAGTSVGTATWTATGSGAVTGTGTSTTSGSGTKTLTGTWTASPTISATVTRTKTYTTTATGTVTSGGSVYAMEMADVTVEVTGLPTTNYWTATGNDIYNNNSGNVGVGTGGAANFRLHLKGSYPNAYLGLQADSAGGGNETGVLFKNGSSTGSTNYKGGIVYHSMSGDANGRGNMWFLMDNTNDTSNVTAADVVGAWTASGNFCIGANDCSALLNVTSTGANTTELRLISTYDGTANDWVSYQSKNAAGTLMTFGQMGVSNFVRTAGHETGQFRFNTYSDGSVGVRMAVTGDGVGIGPTFVSATPPSGGLIVEGILGVGIASPSYRLQVGTSGLFAVDDSGYSYQRRMVLNAAAGGGILRMVPNQSGGDLTLTWPGSVINGYLLSTDGSGNLSWVAPATGTVTGTGAAGALAQWSSTAALEQGPTATATPTANAVPIADGSGKLDGWVTQSTTLHSGDNSGGNVTTDAAGTWATVASVSLDYTGPYSVIANGTVSVTASADLTTCRLRMVFGVTHSVFGPPYIRRDHVSYTLFDTMAITAHTYGLYGANTIDLQLQSDTAGHTCSVMQSEGALTVIRTSP